MLEETNKTQAEDNDNTFSSIDECEEKIEKLNKKLQATAHELEEISRLYAKSVKESLDKSKRIKELEDKIDELEEELKKCKAKRDELEKQLKECQDKNKKLEEELKNCKDNKGEQLEQLKECQEKRAELEKQLKECQDEKAELKNQLKECQENSNNGSNNKKIKNAQPVLKIGTEIWALATDNKGNVYMGIRSDHNKGTIYRCLAGESEFKLIKGIKNGDGVISLAYDNKTNILYASTFNGKNKIDTRDGALYEYDLTEDDGFHLLQRDLPAIWHLEIRDGVPFTDNEYYLNINRNMVWK